ncbi:hypothetical protein LTR10_005714 [Elasticomyces elasticus]|nr:hypothetical protein LTR10_005714 [Elasticomyces elasticus]KAK4964921.1 hypothetical protein LTR42_012338 [Elasticomyces elasticus]
MTTEEHDMWDGLNIEYENAYQDNPFKKAMVAEVISLLAPGSSVLDVGCGTGVPVSQLLAEAGMNVTGTDVAPKMVEHARKRVKGTFEVADMVNYEPNGTYDAIFIVYSQLGLTYAAFHGAVWGLVQSLRPAGILAIGQSPAEDIPKDDPAWDSTHTYVEGYNLPFWGEPFATLMFTRQGQKNFLESIGLDVVYDTLDVFQPDNPKCHPEHQQYVVARRRGDQAVQKPLPLPIQRTFEASSNPVLETVGLCAHQHEVT